ncbi:hypothetical protein ACIHFD_49350 [Nonomuraea sp. NPDC051941]|uniref:hypothetical protein n=1 Tax=Nonomuraea sp. NPDC051941 TaxID=3364373 RepID=UPI0037CABF4F
MADTKSEERNGRRRRGQRDVAADTDQTVRHAVQGLQAPPPLNIRPVTPPEDVSAAPAPLAAPPDVPRSASPPATEAEASTALAEAPSVPSQSAAPELVTPAVKDTESSPAAPAVEAAPATPAIEDIENTPADEDPSAAKDKATVPAVKDAAAPPTKRARRRTPTLGPTSLRNREPRTKHTITILRDTALRILKLQYVETMNAGSEQPKWPHIDAALARLHPDQLKTTELGLSEWVLKADKLMEEHNSDDFVSEGALMRVSTKEAVRTLRVRIKMLGAAHVGAQWVVTAALEDYLDQIGAPTLDENDPM